jgi:hypothetical protein
MIYWVGARDDFVRPTGPFDPELPVWAFRRNDGTVEAVMFNHSTHSIGTHRPGVRSPSFYGLAAQGLSNRQIADRLFISPRTVGSHLYKVYPRLGVSSRRELTRALNRFGDAA